MGNTKKREKDKAEKRHQDRRELRVKKVLNIQLPNKVGFGKLPTWNQAATGRILSNIQKC
jgi:hypothetical protein